MRCTSTPARTDVAIRHQQRARYREARRQNAPAPLRQVQDKRKVDSDQRYEQCSSRYFGSLAAAMQRSLNPGSLKFHFCCIEATDETDPISTPHNKRNAQKEQTSQRHPSEDDVVDNVVEAHAQPDADRRGGISTSEVARLLRLSWPRMAKGISLTALTTVKNTTVIAMNCMRSIFWGQR